MAFANRLFMRLKLFIDSEDIALKRKYQELVESHNLKMKSGSNFDAGFDLYCPSDILCKKGYVINVVDFKIKVAAQMVDSSFNYDNTGFFLYPRSSISGTGLRLANSVGVIDSGYRGSLIAKFDCVTEEYKVNKFDRLMQIVSPTMSPIFVELVDSFDDLGDTTERGSNGFGSSGK
jgi:dUTP pyrophosphatase